MCRPPSLLCDVLSSSLSAGNNLIAGQAAQHPLRDYWEYLAHLFRRQPLPTDDERMSLGYRDFLQVGSDTEC